MCGRHGSSCDLRENKILSTLFTANFGHVTLARSEREGESGGERETVFDSSRPRVDSSHINLFDKNKNLLFSRLCCHLQAAGCHSRSRRAITKGLSIVCKPGDLGWLRRPKNQTASCCETDSCAGLPVATRGKRSANDWWDNGLITQWICWLFSFLYPGRTSSVHPASADSHSHTHRYTDRERLTAPPSGPGGKFGKSLNPLFNHCSRESDSEPVLDDQTGN